MKHLQIRLSPVADKDLTDIEEYISEELSDPQAAKNTIRSIVEEYEKLANFPELGTDISSALGIKTRFRRLVCGHYHVFYKVDASFISIYRILYDRRNYIGILFGTE